MKLSPTISPRAGFLPLLLFMVTASTAIADHLIVTRHFTGIWTQPDHVGQGLVLQITDQEDDSKLAVAYWFTYGSDLLSSWYLAVGPVVGHGVEMTLFRASGADFLSTDVDTLLDVEAIGTMTLNFRNCNHGTAAFETPEDVLGSGEFRIWRLSRVYRSRCTGGLSDDTPPDARPMKMSVRLHSARDDIAAEGLAMLHQNPDHMAFRVSAEGLPDGMYALQVCTEPRGVMEVVGGEGSIDFRSPAVDDKPLLNFDPRNCLIELLDDLGAVLTSGDAVLAEKHNNGHGNDAPPDG